MVRLMWAPPSENFIPKSISAELAVGKDDEKDEVGTLLVPFDDDDFPRVNGLVITLLNEGFSNIHMAGGRDIPANSH